ncbi:CBN-BCA-1 protein [Caenorhabditis brenneri]|uniref:Carbonic anhydrase n=1 Tax=Caenorhabditis brenneri TaxID=135651 RepID=G0MSW4_CAEBE|nr:CBN-BCA-1 protein [Caenorhabditis brenneri]
MNKILRGVIQFRNTIRKDLVKQFEEVKNNPSPTAVMFTCMDSRMLPTRFTQSQVGDMFVVRNAGNMIPDAPNYGAFSEVSVNTEPAALELAVKRGGIRHIVVCGHSDCKAINTLYGLHQCPKNFDVTSPMDHWVRRNGFASVKRLNERLHLGPSNMSFESEVSPSQSFEAIIDPMDRLPVEDKLSQINVLQQLINICSHEFLKEYLESGRLHIHGMWFDIYKGEDYLFSKDKKRFVVIDEKTVTDLLAELNTRYPLPEDQDGPVAFAQSN